MNKTALIIVGGLAVLGIGAYFYFKPKAKASTSGLPSGASSLTNTTSGSSTTGSSTTSSSATDTQTTTSNTPAKNDTVLNTAPIVNPTAPVTTAQSAQIAEDLAKYYQAQSLANQIFTLTKSLKPEPSIFGTSWGDYNLVLSQNAQIRGEIKNILTKMNALGYKEVNGVATKL